MQLMTTRTGRRCWGSERPLFHPRVKNIKTFGKLCPRNLTQQTERIYNLNILVSQEARRGGNMYYASIGIISLIILVIVNFEALRKVEHTEANVVRIMYRHFLFSLMLYFVSDAMWGFLYEQRWVIPTFIDTCMFFFSMVLSVLLWTRCVVAFTQYKGKLNKLLVGSGWVIFCFEVLVLIVNIFVPIVFKFDANKEYVALPARYITLFMQMILFFATAVFSFVISFKSEGKNRLNYRTVAFSGLLMTIFIALQMFYPLMPFYALGCLFSICTIHSFIYKSKDIEHGREMANANQKAYRDGLTGVRNKLAYLESLRDLELDAKRSSSEGYGLVVFDLNGLKLVNDTLGHEAGDEMLQKACKLICNHYKHSPVFRIGGDEFVVILKGTDFDQREMLEKQFEDMIDENQRNGDVVVSSGMAVFDSAVDESYTEVFIRADKKMYARKQALKSAAV